MTIDRIVEYLREEDFDIFSAGFKDKKLKGVLAIGKEILLNQMDVI